MIFPNDLKYSAEHTWVRVDEERATIGITDFAQSGLGSLISIDLIEEGSRIERKGLFGVLETSKVSFELYAPLGGTVIKGNHQLSDQIGLVNQEPYGTGWMIVLHMSDSQDLADLMDADGYQEYIKRWAQEETGVE